MAKVQCPNGHRYDSNIYGDECPICGQRVGQAPSMEASETFGMPPFETAQSAAGGTHVTNPQEAPVSSMPQGSFATMDPTGNTHLKNQHPAVPGGTVIKPGPGKQQMAGRRLVGFLVTYNRNPMGKAFNLYEGKNYIGREYSCDISVPDDSQMSGRHMSILYRSIDNKFKFRDEQSSNGTFVNKELIDEGELQNYDIIRLGSTVFIFIAIPKLG